MRSYPILHCQPHKKFTLAEGRMTAQNCIALENPESAHIPNLLQIFYLLSHITTILKSIQSK